MIWNYYQNESLKFTCVLFLVVNELVMEKWILLMDFIKSSREYISHAHTLLYVCVYKCHYKWKCQR